MYGARLRINAVVTDHCIVHGRVLYMKTLRAAANSYRKQNNFILI
jgi:hypothetical protein